MDKKIQLTDYGSSFGPRVLGQKIKDNVINILKEDRESIIIFDFANIEIISSGFAQELFGELWVYLKDDFSKRVRFKFDKNSDLIKQVIIQGIHNRQKKLNR